MTASVRSLLRECGWNYPCIFHAVQTQQLLWIRSMNSARPNCALTVRRQMICSIGATDLMLSCIDVMRRMRGIRCRQESGDLEMSCCALSPSLEELYFWNQHTLVLIEYTQRIRGKSYIIWTITRARDKNIVLLPLCQESCFDFIRKTWCEIHFSYIPGCSNGKTGLKQICCGYKCIRDDLQVFSIHQNLLLTSYTQWVAPWGDSLWEACG